MRKLKYHESKLLKKVDFLTWTKEDNIRETKILRRYHIQKREDYLKYNKITGMVTSLVTKLRALPADNPLRIASTEALLRKLFNMGLVKSEASLAVADELAASVFARRRLPVVIVRLKFSQTLKEAVTFVEQGHIRVGPEVVSDPAFLVSRTMEDFVTWVDSSKIKRAVATYNDQLDDYDLMG